MNKYNYIESGLRMNLNEHPLSPLELLNKSIDLEQMRLNRYIKQEDGPLIKALASYNKIDEDCIVCGNGADEIISNLVDCFCSERILIIEPTFGVYKHYAKLKNKEIYLLKLNEDFSLPEDKIIKIANDKKIDLVIICNPNNPTGNLFCADKIIKILKNTNSYVLLDEAYFEFAKKSLVDDIANYNNLLIVRTLSKAFALAGLRVGYCMSNKDNIKKIRNSQMPFNISNFSQFIATAALAEKKTFLDYVKNITFERDKLIEKLKELNLLVYPSATNFILVDFGNISKMIYQELQKRDIHIRLSDFNTNNMKNTLRISVGLPKENDQFIKELTEIIEGMPNE